jgi:hypothetical protein
MSTLLRMACRRLPALISALVLLAGGSCIIASEYFGIIDPEAWEQAHPAAPPPPAEAGPYQVEVVSTRRIVPGEGLPPEARVARANNNLDVVRHADGRVYLAWRSAPSHFAGDRTVINVVSSVDETTWRFEARFAPGFDLREPRWLSHGDQLVLYVSRLGSNPFAFEPRGISMTARQGDGRWSALEPVGPPGFIAWRVRVVDGRPLMIGYSGGGSIYNFDGNPLRVQIMTTSDGRKWVPAWGQSGVVLRGGDSETDFGFDPSGGLFAVTRNEAGDAGGFGSKVCHAPAGRPDSWSCRSDSKKYDSPLVFAYGDELYVTGRRNVTRSGRYDVFGGPHLLRAVRNALAYVVTAKRCSLWRIDRAQNRLAFVLDLPSRGDTCFASMIPGQRPGEVIIYDYSSDIAGPDLPWAAGQRRPTYIYRHVLRFTRQDRS